MVTNGSSDTRYVVAGNLAEVDPEHFDRLAFNRTCTAPPPRRHSVGISVLVVLAVIAGLSVLAAIGGSFLP